MIYFIIISVFLLFYAIFAWRYFRYAFYFLIFYIPFQVALNPLIVGIDIATGRLMILILFSVLIGKNMLQNLFPSVLSTFWRNCDKILTPLGSDLISQLLLMFLVWSGISIFWSDNWIWGLRKWLVFASIFPLYLVVIYALNGYKTSSASAASAMTAVPARMLHNGLGRATAVIITVSAFFAAAAAIIQFAGQFIWDGHKVFHFWARNFFPIFLGQKFGETVFQYQSWFVELSGKTIMRAVGFFPDPHTLGFYIGLVFPLSLITYFSIVQVQNGKLLRIFYIVAIFSLFITTFLTFARSAYLGLAAGLSAFFILGWKFLESRQKIFLSFLIFLAILFFFIPKTPVAERFSSSFNAKEISNIGRLSNLDEALLIVKQHPIRGVGIGSYPLNIGLLRQQAVDYRTPIYAHNIYLDIWAEMGIIGLLLWIGVFFIIFCRGFRALFYADRGDKLSPVFLAGLLSALIWFSAQGFFDTPIFSPRVLPILMIVLAINTQLIKKINKVKSCLLTEKV